MSLDRFLAINNLAGCKVRNKKNTIRIVLFLWIFVLLTNLPHLFLWEDYSYSIESKNRTGLRIFSIFKIKNFSKILLEKLI
jgi:hypothetical protein